MKTVNTEVVGIKIYLMFGKVNLKYNPNLTALQVKCIMMESHGHEVLDASGNALTKTDGEVYYLPDAEKCVKKH